MSEETKTATPSTGTGEEQAVEKKAQVPAQTVKKAEDTGNNEEAATGGEGDADGEVDEVRNLLDTLAEDGDEEEEGGKNVDDDRSIFVGNVDFSTTAEELHDFFKDCGTLDKITIKTNAAGKPKGFAYIMFNDKDSVENALALDGELFKDRVLKVSRKRQNIPGMKRGRGRGRGRRGRGGFPMGYAYIPFFPRRGRGRGRGGW